MAFNQATATTSAQQVLPFNEKRTAWVIQNQGAATVYISGDGTVSSSGGFPLSTGSAASFVRRDGDDARAAVYAVTAAGTADLRIQESFEPISIGA